MIRFAAAALAAFTSFASAQVADVIYRNAVIFTADADRPTASAVAIGGDRIIAVGSDADAMRTADGATRVVDLGGAFVTPGFIDSHVHFQSSAAFQEFNLMRTREKDEFVRRVEEVIQTIEPGEWIVGGLWGAYDEWAEGSAGGSSRAPFSPDMRAVDELTHDYPMFLRKYDSSEFAANSAAMRAVGLDPRDPEADGITFDRGDDGRPTGVMRGRGVRPLFTPNVPSGFSYERRLEQSRRALQMAAEAGVTGLHDMSDDTQITIYRDLLERGELTARINFRYTLDRWKEVANAGITTGSGDEWIRFGALKGFIDGIMGTSTARFFDPYNSDPGNSGRWRTMMLDENGDPAPDQFLAALAGADKAGLQITVHAIGDLANRTLLDMLVELDRINGPRDRRFRLVHAQVIAPEDFSRLGPLGIIAEVQPFHLSDDMRWMEERIGTDRCRGAYAFRSIMDSGARLSFGSDWPGTSAAEYPINPMLGLFAAVERKTITGLPEAGWFPEQRISIEDAIRAFTIDNAYASYEEDIKGSIEVGKLADLVVWSANLVEVEPEQLLETKPLVTMVGGKVVYEAEK
ncbi:MAG: amidohydrolase [Planctomycetota bacterium]